MFLLEHRIVFRDEGEPGQWPLLLKNFPPLIPLALHYCLGKERTGEAPHTPEATSDGSVLIHYCRCWEYIREETDQAPAPPGAYILWGGK